MPEVLLEIGCEEIPASWLAGLGEQLQTRFTEAADREHLAPQAVQAYPGPRRLVLRADVAERQADREESVWGPALRAAKDAAGAWTPAALGFAKKNGVDASALGEGMKEGGKEKQLRFVRRIAGQAARDVLPGVVAATLRGLAFPKRMSWDAWLDDGKGAFPFGRPIRWMVLLLGGQVVPFRIFEMVAGAAGPVAVEAGDRTWGHRFLPRETAGARVAVSGFADLKEKLSAHHVLVDPGEREARIRAGLGRAGVTGEALHHPLVEEWRDLVEWPTIVGGTVPPEFRTLPVEVLETVLVHHQKYVPVREGAQVARFAAVTNIDEGPAAGIVRGMERVVVARLRDAAFFFGEDRKRTLASRVDDLQGVTFHRGLGTYLDKSTRLVRLVDAMDRGGVLADGVAPLARDAARLCKADLTTLMVREFTELQGVMGGIYLEADGAAPEVAEAVRWHYHPLSVDAASAPAGLVARGGAATFAAVSLADKLDTVAGYFGLGMIPTGSSDPYGLRRAAQGAIRVVLDFWPGRKRPSLRAVLAEAVAAYPNLAKTPEEMGRDGEAFLLDRLRFVLGARGYPADEVEAVLGAREPDALDDAAEALKRLEALHQVRSDATDDFQALATAFKRARNILSQGAAAAVDPARFENDAERLLWAEILGLRESGGSYEGRLQALASLRAPVDRFFDDVLVMAEDPLVRANRLGLLSEVLALFYRIADISRLAS